jgi:hypothetical protein
VRSFETKERYELIIADAEKKVNFLKNKLKDLKNNLDADEKELRFISRPFKKKEAADSVPAENSSNSESKENSPILEAVTSEETVQDAPVANDDGSTSEITQIAEEQDIKAKENEVPHSDQKISETVSDESEIEHKEADKSDEGLMHFDENTDRKQETESENKDPQ